MGTKRKSSSKRKGSKISSEARQRKKSRRTKSKKLYHRDDSASSYSDDDSRSSVSISSSSSHDHRRRARSRMRSDAKGSRKRTRSSLTRDSSEYSRHVKKRKGSRKSRYSDVKKKTQKKKRRRDASISPISSDTHSCSTCKGGSSNSSGESEFVRPRGRSRESKKYKRDLGKPTSGTKNKKNRSQSRSSCSRCSDSSGYTIKEKLADGNNLRRLKSVVIVTKQPQEEEEKEWDKSGHKEEVIYDQDDYPSYRSNDSDDGGNKRDLSHHAHDASEKRSVEYAKGEEAFISNASTIELTESGKDGGDQYDGSSSRSDGAGANNPSKGNKSEVSAVVSSSNVDDLETILRQKALENLRKFRKGRHTDVRTLPDQKTRSEQPSSAKAEFVQIKSPKCVDPRVVGAPQVITQSTRPMTGIESSCPTRIDGKISEGKYSGIEPGTAKCPAVCPPDQVTISGNPEEKDLSCTDAVFNKSEHGRSALRQEFSGTCSTIKQAPMSQASPKLVTDSGVNKCAVEASQIVRKTSNKNGTEVSNAPDGSCLKPTSEEHSSKERQNEVKDGSQFEQKTMSVMRGGEMVQVSYKVYIPKKAPALARRQLRRTGSDV